MIKFSTNFMFFVLLYVLCGKEMWDNEEYFRHLALVCKFNHFGPSLLELIKSLLES